MKVFAKPKKACASQAVKPTVRKADSASTWANVRSKTNAALQARKKAVGNLCSAKRVVFASLATVSVLKSPRLTVAASMLAKRKVFAHSTPNDTSVLQEQQMIARTATLARKATNACWKKSAV